MIPIISFIGHHNAGKTRLITRLAEILTERGWRVGAVKHAPHLMAADPPGTDSQQLRESGSRRILLLGNEIAVMSWPAPRPEDLESSLLQWFSDCDLVLVEGLKHGPFPKIEVFRRIDQIPQEPLAGEIDVIAVVSDASFALPDGVACFSPRNREMIADYIETEFLHA